MRHSNTINEKTRQKRGTEEKEGRKRTAKHTITIVRQNNDRLSGRVRGDREERRS